jgi:glycosyltransferase involved in cell wall biosynthesis
VFLFAAKMLEMKQPFAILDAYEKMGDFPSKALIMAGDGPLLGSLKSRVQARKIPKVVFPGFINQREMPKYYAISDVFMRPDVWSTGDWGLTVNEAAAAGMALVVTEAVGAGVDLVRDGENGFVVPMGDISAMATAMKRFLESPGLCASMGVKSEQIARTWSYRQCVEGVLGALESLERNHRAE